MPFKKMLIKKYQITILLLLASVSLKSQEQRSVLWFNNIISNEFSKNYNYYIFQDSKGFVWISSITGLNRYDGARVKPYRSIAGDSTSLYGENIHSNFFEDKRGDIWFSTFEAIHVYNRKYDRFKHFFVKDEKGVDIQKEYRVFFVEKDSFIWLRAGDNIYRYDFRTGHQSVVIHDVTAKLFAVDTNAVGEVQHLYPMGALDKNDKKYYLITNGQLKDKLPWCMENMKGKPPTRISIIKNENDSVAWVATDVGLFLWDRIDCHWERISEKWAQPCDYIEKWGEQYIVALFKDVGLVVYDKKYRTFTKWETRFINKEIPINDFLYLYIDRDDNLWVSHESNGLSFANLKKNKFYSFPKSPAKDGNVNYSYWSFLEDADGWVWYGTNTSGIFSISPKGEVKNYYIEGGAAAPGGQRKNWVTSLKLDNENRIWAGTRGGLFYFNKATDQFVRIGYGNEGLDILNMYWGKEEGLFVQANGIGVLKLVSQGGRYSLQNIYRAKGAVSAMMMDNQKHAFLSRDDAQLDVFEVVNDSFHFVKTLPIKGIVSSYMLDSDGHTLWVGSLFGLAKVNLDTLGISGFYTDQNGLPDKAILSILPERDNGLWLSTPKGLVLFDKEKKSQLFSLADGTQSSEFYLYCGLLRSNGEKWFAGTEGISIIPPDGLLQPFVNTKPQLLITAIKINDELKELPPCKLTGSTNVSQIQHLELSPSDNTISFEFVAVEYSDPQNNQLKYFLEGVDKDTVTLAKGEPGFARYPNLPPGTHTFVLRGANSDGVWGEAHQVIKITILPKWHQKTWVRLLGVALLGLLAYLVFRTREQQIKEKEALNTRISENKMEALRSQMNPHFVFNSLQTVNGFITRQDLRGAIQYVNQFAKLMRMILENSRAGMISLEKEIELLEMYMFIEAKRFSKPFTYKINVGDDLDTYDTMIPSMILQPFVENAIKHGLFHKKEEGHIAVGFHRENGYLKCYVEDNGVGRKKSMVLNEQEGRSHVSRGLQIVNERLELIRKSKQGEYDVRIIDLSDLDHHPTGTRVEVRLPFMA